MLIPLPHSPSPWESTVFRPQDPAMLVTADAKPRVLQGTVTDARWNDAGALELFLVSADARPSEVGGWFDEARMRLNFDPDTPTSFYRYIASSGKDRATFLRRLATPELNQLVYATALIAGDMVLPPLPAPCLTLATRA